MRISTISLTVAMLLPAVTSSAVVVAAPVASGSGSVEQQQQESAGASTRSGIDRERSLTVEQSRRESASQERSASESTSLRRDVPAHALIVPALTDVPHDRLSECAQIVSEARYGWPSSVVGDGWGFDTAAMAAWARERTVCALFVSDTARAIADRLGVVTMTTAYDAILDVASDLDLEALYADAKREVGSRIVLQTASGGPPRWTVGYYQVGYGQDDGMLSVSRAGVPWFGAGTLSGANTTIAFAQERSQSSSESRERAKSRSASATREQEIRRERSTSAESTGRASTSAQGGSQ